MSRSALDWCGAVRVAVFRVAERPVRAAVPVVPFRSTADRATADRDDRLDLAPDAQLPMDTRLWAALQNVSGGTWSGCVFDVDTIVRTLEAGKKADLILISLQGPNAVPTYDVYAGLAYALKGSDVETVVIGGRVVMREHKLLTVKEEEAVAKAREYRKTVAASLGLQ